VEAAVSGPLSRRVARRGSMDPRELVAHDRNWRLHPVDQREAMRAALESLGWLEDVMVSERTGRILNGHLRVEDAIKRGDDVVPTSWVDLDAGEELFVLETFDAIAGLAVVDREKLAALAGLLPAATPAPIEALLETLSRGPRDRLGGGGGGSSEPGGPAHKCPRCGNEW